MEGGGGGVLFGVGGGGLGSEWVGGARWGRTGGGEGRGDGILDGDGDGDHVRG